jgi:hypothetical protein
VSVINVLIALFFQFVPEIFIDIHCLNLEKIINPLFKLLLQQEYFFYIAAHAVFIGTVDPHIINGYHPPWLPGATNARPDWPSI